jgi:hypothetical protein
MVIPHAVLPVARDNLPHCHTSTEAAIRVREKLQMNLLTAAQHCP